MATAGLLAAAEVSEQAELTRTGEVLRNIARGGIAGVVAGTVVGGLGGRLLAVGLCTMIPLEVLNGPCPGGE